MATVSWLRLFTTSIVRTPRTLRPVYANMVKGCQLSPTKDSIQWRFNSRFIIGLRREYHCTSISLAKQAKKPKSGKGKHIDDDDDEGESETGGIDVKPPDLKELEGQMEKKINRLTEEFSKLRTGQANTEIFKTMILEAHGSTISVAEAGQVAIKSPTKATISVFDPLLVPNVAKAIRECGMSLNPSIEGNNVSVSIPKPSKETREALMKTAGKTAEKTKQDIRQVRKFGMDAVKKLKGAVSEDDTRKYSKDIDALMEKKIEKVAKVLKDKETEILR